MPYTPDFSDIMVQNGMSVAAANYLEAVLTPLVSSEGYLYGSRGSALPFVMPSSGTINNTSGSVTATTTFDYTIGPSYTYFPVGALFASSPAGWYYTNWSVGDNKTGTVYANTYANGNAQIPANPTPLTAVAGAYTQVTGFDVIGPSFIVPGNVLGPNGSIEWHRAVNNNNSANNKVYNTYLGASNFQGLTQTTNPKEGGMGVIRNRGHVARQAAANAAHGDNNNASGITKLTIDTTQAQVFGFALQLTNASDFAMIESHGIKIYYGA